MVKACLIADSKGAIGGRLRTCMHVAVGVARKAKTNLKKKLGGFTLLVNEYIM